MTPEYPAVWRIAMRAERLRTLLDMKAPPAITGRERWLLLKAIDQWTVTRGEVIPIEESAD